VNRETQPVRRQGDAEAFWLCVTAGVVSVVLRALYLTQPWRIDLSVPRAYVATEGLMGIRALHILAGARPVFLVDGAYFHGSFEAYVTAVAFQLFGASMTVLRLVPTLLAMGWVVLTGLLAARLYGKRAGYLAAALMALPAQFVFEWGCTAWSGYARIMLLLIGMYLLVLLLGRVTARRIGALGFVAGISLWETLLSLGSLAVYALALLTWVRPTRRQWALLLIAGAIGVAPLIYGNVQHPLASVRALGARVRLSLVWHRGFAQLPEEEEGQVHFFQSTPLFQVLGAQPRHDGRWSMTGSASALFLAIGTVGGAWMSYRRRRQNPFAFRCGMLLLACVAMGLMSGISGFYGEPVARYSIPLYPAACVLAAGWLVYAWPRSAVPVVALLAVANAVQLAAPIHGEARTPTPAIIDALLAHGLSRGFGADNMYDLVFDSGERVIIQPIEWTWIQRYGDIVLASDRLFYLYRDDQEHKVSYQVFMSYLADRGIQYRRFDVGEYHVLYDFEPAGSINAHAIAEMRSKIRQHKDRSRRRLS
jgi:hypothetical protein